MNQRGCSFGSLNQRGCLLVCVCQRSWVLTALRTESKSSAESSPWNLSVTESPDCRGKLKGCLVEKEHGRGKMRTPRCQVQVFHRGCLMVCEL